MEKQNIIQQNNTHKAVCCGDKIKIFIKGCEIPAEGDDPGMKWEDEYLYSIPYENRDDLFSIFENFDEENRINRAEFESAMKGI